MIARYQLLSAIVLAATLAACSAAYRTDLFRVDELTDAQEAVAYTRFNSGDMSVAGSVDRKDTTYEPGQPITLSVKTNIDGYVAVLRVLANGDTAIVFPNRAHPSAAIKANTPLTIPAAGEAVKIAGEKPGVVLFEFVAAANGNSWVFKRAPDAGSDFAYLGATTHQIAKDLATNLKPGPGHDTAAVYLTVKIAGRGLW
jgi:hypothetical protein